MGSLIAVGSAGFDFYEVLGKGGETTHYRIGQALFIFLCFIVLLYPLMWESVADLRLAIQAEGFVSSLLGLYLILCENTSSSLSCSVYQ